MCIYIYCAHITYRLNSGSTRPADVYAVTISEFVLTRGSYHQWIHKHDLLVRMYSQSLQRFPCSLSLPLQGKPLEAPDQRMYMP